MSSRRALSIRVPSDIYCQIASLAQTEGVDLNMKINELILMGLGEQRSLTEALHLMIKRYLFEENKNAEA